MVYWRTSNNFAPPTLRKRNGPGSERESWDLGSVGQLGHDDRLTLGRDALARSLSARSRPFELDSRRLKLAY